MGKGPGLENCPNCSELITVPIIIGNVFTCWNCKKEINVVSAEGGHVLLEIASKESVSEGTDATCPECEGRLKLKPDVQEGEIVVCGDCGVDLEVITLTPTVTLALAPQEAEDWGE